MNIRRILLAAAASAAMFFGSLTPIAANDPAPTDHVPVQPTDPTDPVDPADPPEPVIELFQFRIAKTVTVNENTPEPMTSFKFAITCGSDYTSSDQNNPTASTATPYPVKAGVSGVLPETVTIDFLGQFYRDKAPSGAEGYFDKEEQSYTRFAGINVDYTKAAVKNLDPGIYHYVISEVIPTGTDAYSGMQYVNQSYDLFFFHYNGSQPDQIIAAKAGAVLKDEKAADQLNISEKAAVRFTNNFNQDDGEYGTRTVEVISNVTGNMCNPDQWFEYKITVNDSTEKNSDPAKRYTIELFGNDAISHCETYNRSQVEDHRTKEHYFFTFAAHDDLYIQLQGNHSFYIYGLGPDDVITTIETDGIVPQPEGYTMTKEHQPDPKADPVKVDVDGTPLGNFKNNGKIIYTHEKGVQGPTGLLMTTAPYLLIGVLAVGGLMIFIRRRNKEAEE